VSAETEPTARLDPEADAESRVSPLELFFDLVFVLSFTQVTLTMAENPTWEGVGEGLLILLAVWWAWAAYSWLTNLIDTDENVNRVCMLAAMGAMLIVSLAIPEAFGDEGVLFGLAYLVVRVLQLVLYLRNAHTGDDDNFAAFARLTPGFLAGSVLIVVAGLVDGGARTSLWIIALAIDIGIPALRGVSTFHIKPGHFAERYGLIVIIALGESIVAVGSGAGLDLTAVEVVAGLLAITAIAALWWAYFDVVSLVAERRLREAEPSEQATLARDSYSYLHFPMIAGIVLLALGLKKVLGDVEEPLKDVGAVALCGGAALYLLAHIAIRLRNLRTLNVHRSVATFLLLALIPLALEADAVVSLAAVTAVLAGLVAFEAIHFREARARVRANPDATLAEMRGRSL
jgi:low temperature requirement protein LtrA